MFVPGCMWQTMHWLDGNRARELVADGMSGLVLRNGGIGGCGCPRLPNCA